MQDGVWVSLLKLKTPKDGRMAGGVDMRDYSTPSRGVFYFEVLEALDYG